VDLAVIDAELTGLVAPYTERTAARALVTLTRGSTRPLPAGRHLRLFCHWTETAGGPRVDLDLSVAFYNQAWRHVATCDYTSLRVDGAVHSGDLTSAPPPGGSSEFVDLDVDELAAAGARYAERGGHHRHPATRWRHHHPDRAGGGHASSSRTAPTRCHLGPA
jgi:hypothetical protein